MKKIDLTPKKMLFYSKPKPTAFKNIKDKDQSVPDFYKREQNIQKMMQPSRPDAEDHKKYKSKGF